MRRRDMAGSSHGPRLRWHHRPGHASDLVGKRDGGDLGRPTRQQCRKPWSMLGAVELGIADHGERAGGEQAAQIAVSLFADVAELVFATARVLLRYEPNPGREIPSRSKRLGITNARDQRSRKGRADTRDGVKSLAGLVRSVPCHDAAIEGQDLGFQCQQLSPESSNAGPCYLWQPSVVGIGDDFEQLLDTTAPNRCDDPELGQVRANGIDDGCLLANEQMARAMKRQTALLLGGLGRHKPAAWPRDGFANRFRVSCVLVSFDVRLDVGRWHQLYGVTERLELARPIMRRCTCLDAYKARRQLLKERQNITPLELTANNHVAIPIDAVNLKTRLREIETNRRGRLHDLAPPNHWLLQQHPLRWHSRADGGAVHSIKTGLMRRSKDQDC